MWWHLSSESVSYIVSTLVKKAGIKVDVRAHSIRRFFETTFENPEIGIHPAWIKRMMGISRLRMSVRIRILQLSSFLMHMSGVVGFCGFRGSW
jgi:hypothetical protein